MNNTDLFAVTQADSNELKTVTTEQVAERVAEIVSTDQVQELISDLAMGKQILAQKLNDKGAGVTTNDTLIQMAAKIDPLDVVGAKEYAVQRPVICGYTYQPPSFAGSPCGRLNKVVQISPSTVVIGKLNTSNGVDSEIVIPFTYATNTTAAYTGVTISNNNNYLAIALRQSSANVLQVYSVDWQTNTATLKYEHTYTNTSNGHIYGLYVSNDGSRSFCFIASTSSTSGRYYVYYDHTQDVESNGNISISNIDTDGGYWDEENNLIYFTGYYSQTNSKWGLGVSTINITDTGASVSAPTAIISNPSDIYHSSKVVIIKDLDLCVCHYAIGSNSNYTSLSNNRRYALRSFRMSTGELLNTYEYYPTYNLADYAKEVSVALDPAIWYDNGKYYISTSTGVYASVNASGQFIGEPNNPSQEPNKIELLYLCANTSSDKTAGCIYYVNDTPIFIKGSGAFGSFNTGHKNTVTFYPMTIYNPCVVGIQYSRNTNSIMFYRKFNVNEYDAGAYAIDDTSAVLDLTK